MKTFGELRESLSTLSKASSLVRQLAKGHPSQAHIDSASHGAKSNHNGHEGAAHYHSSASDDAKGAAKKHHMDASNHHADAEHHLDRYAKTKNLEHLRKAHSFAAKAVASAKKAGDVGPSADVHKEHERMKAEVAKHGYKG